MILEAAGITKRFGSFAANQKLSFNLKPGEIHSIVGENGAGKSTFAKILCGLLTPDEGELRVDGQVQILSSAASAFDLGIGMVHQHFMLAGQISVLDNLIVGDEPKVTKAGVAWPWIDRQAASAKLHKLSLEWGASLRPQTLADDLLVGEQQRLEIFKLLFRHCRVLIFDEPTAVLTPQEIDVFLQQLRALASTGKSIVLITHKLREVLEVSDRITVLKAGKLVTCVARSTVDARALAELMVGRDMDHYGERYPRDARGGGEPARSDVLSVQNLGGGRLKSVSLRIKPGEILGIAGIEGSGQSDLLQFLWGLKTPEAGTIKVNGRDIKQADVLERRRQGMALVPEDRHREAIFLDMGIRENFYAGLRHRKKMASDPMILKARDEFDIKFACLDSRLDELSGGNQQKLVLARELSRELDCQPKILLAAHPTRGVDIGAISQIHRELMRRRSEGLSILLISSELDELLQLSDRILVLKEGEIVRTCECTGMDLGALRYQIGEAML